MSRKRFDNRGNTTKEKRMSERIEREIVLSPNEFAFVLDKTKGLITCYMGPNKPSLSSTDSTVLFNEDSKRFEPVDLDRAVQTFKTAPENWYMVMKNPAKDAGHPNSYGANSSPGLQIGKKVNIHGPASFALWPGQMVKVIQGHKLQSNQYILVRIYDHDEANKNLEAIFGGDTLEGMELVAGQKVVIKGTDVSFYMPPTGAEVVPDENGDLVRDAVTLERLEYCVLIGENGEKEYRRGEDVVFPKPNQQFLTKKGSRKFRAIELNDTSGLHIKVIAPYTDLDGTEYKEGEELFITGRNTIYFPRKEHAIIHDENGDQLHRAVAIPKGEGLYDLNKNSGEVKTVVGPKMFLPDPRNEAITQRILSDRECELLYPNNSEALNFNRRLRGTLNISNDSEAVALAKMVKSAPSKRSRGLVSKSAAESLAGLSQASYAGDGFTRTEYDAKPKSITIDNKYRGAVSCDIWSGFAIQIIDKEGNRRVVRGPINGVLLEYDETVEALHLSSGKPKTTDNILTTAFLKTQNNYVSDIIGVISSDLVMAQIKVKYLVDFTGTDMDKWFAVDNYVKLLCDHARSKIKAVARKTSVREFQQNIADIIRDTILGAKPDNGSRLGLLFTENNMVVKDVDVLHFEITQKEVRGLLFDSQMKVVQDNILLTQKEAELEKQIRLERISREITLAKQETDSLERKVKLNSEEEEFEFQKIMLSIGDTLRRQREAAQASAVEHEALIQKSRLKIREDDHVFELKRKTDLQNLSVEYLQKKVDGAVKQAQAFTPHIVEAVKRLGDSQLLSSLAENFGELAAIEGKGLLATVNKFLDFKHTGAVIPMLKEKSSGSDDQS